METDNHEIKDKLMITSSGLIGSQKIKTENNDEDCILFGAKEPDEEPVNKYFIIISNFLYLYIGWKNRLLFTNFTIKSIRN